MPLTIGQVLQYRYFIARMLGRGGMGAVYQATDQRLNMQSRSRRRSLLTPMRAPSFSARRNCWRRSSIRACRA